MSAEKILHRFPESALCEINTSERITAFLKETQPDSLFSGIGGHGIVATDISGTRGKHIALRAELDALPVAESNDFVYASESPLRAHLCRHDGHMAVLCGLVNMNLLMLDVTDVPDCRIGDEVVMIGEQKGQEVTVLSFSELAQRLNYETLVRIPENIPRIIV